MNRFFVTCSTAEKTKEAQQLAKLLTIPFIQKIDDNRHEKDSFCLSLTPERLELKEVYSKPQHTIYIDFVRGRNEHRRLYGGGKKQPLGRAVGMKKQPYPTVLDATAGLGRDGWVLACLGCQVHLVERSPIVGALLHDALTRAKSCEQLSKITARIKLTIGDSATLIKNGTLENKAYDVIYLDPMYPPRNKSAQVKKEMQMLHQVIGNPPDTEPLLEAALEYAKKRVVVKRPGWAPFLNDVKPSLSIEGKKTRFDVYLK